MSRRATTRHAFCFASSWRVAVAWDRRVDEAIHSGALLEEQISVTGEPITVLAPGSGTGSYEIFRQAGLEGSGPPPHCHPWDESFYVVSCDIAFGLGNKNMIVEPGTLVHPPVGTMHRFRFKTSPLKTNCVSVA